MHTAIVDIDGKEIKVSLVNFRRKEVISMARRKPRKGRQKGVRVKRLTFSGRKRRNLLDEAAKNRKAKAKSAARSK